MLHRTVTKYSIKGGKTMKSKTITMKRVIVALVAMLMVVSSLACANNDTTGDVATTNGGAADDGAALSVSEITFPLAEPVEFTVFVYALASGGGTYQDNFVTDWIRERTNITLNFVHDVDGDDARTQLNLVMTDPNNLPDIFLATNWTKAEVQAFGAQGLLMPLNELLEDAPNWNLKNELAPTRRADLTMPDGNIYTWGCMNECYHCMFQNRMWIYMPWVYEYNDGQIPQTTEELHQWLLRIKESDPNRLPISGMIGGWATDPTVWLTNSFTQSNNPLDNTNPTVGGGMVVRDGQVDFYIMSEAYRDALRFMNQLWEDGLMDPQIFTRDWDQYLALLDNEPNLVAMYPCGLPAVDFQNVVTHQAGRWQDWQVFEPVAGPNGVRYAAMNLTNYFGSAIGSLSHTNPHPEIAVALFNFLASEEATIVQSFGPEGYAWQYVTEGTALDGGTPLFQNLHLPEDFDWVGHGFARDFAHPRWVSDAMIGNRSVAFRSSELIENAETHLEYTLNSAAIVYHEFAPDVHSILPNLAFPEAEAREISEFTITIGGYVNQSIVQFITGVMDIENDWDSFLQTLVNMGVERYIQIHQDALDEFLAATR